MNRYPKEVTIEGFPSVSVYGLFLLDPKTRALRELGSLIKIPDAMNDDQVPLYKLTLTRVDPKPRRKAK